MSQIPFGEQKQGKAIIYIRVSTEEQVDNYSLGTQEEICRKEADKRGFEVMELFREEGRSAKTITGRPVLIEMLEYCRKHKRDIDALIVYRLDRISRQTADYLVIRKKLVEYDIKLISATEPTGNSPTEKFIETMLAGFAQMDNDVRSERSRNGLRARFSTGLVSYAPMGYLNQNGYVIPDPIIFEKFQEAWHIMATGTKSLRELADILTEQGVAQRQKGGHLTAQSLNRMFRNKFYIGKVVSKKYGQEVMGQHPPMVTEELFYQVQAVLDGRNHQAFRPISRRNLDNKDFPLRRLVKCKRCGASYTGGWSKGKNNRYAYYFCPKRCGSRSFSVIELQEATIDFLHSISLKEGTASIFNSFLRRTYFERISVVQKNREQADKELKKQYELRQALIGKNLTGIYSDEIFKEQNKIIEEKVKTIFVAKNDELIEKYNLEQISNFVKEKLGNLAETYQNSSLGQIKMLLCSIYPQGLPWDEEGYSNTKISKFYNAILALQQDPVSFGGESGI